MIPKQIAFSGGQIVMTCGVEALVNKSGLNIHVLLQRHFLGDDGDLCPEDHEQNVAAIKTGEARVFSSYNTSNGKIWIITEWDRSVTTILLPSEY